MDDRRRSSAVRQAELIDAALAIIANQGIAALTTRSLAERVGLTTGAIFRHFASIDAVLDAVAARVESVLDATYPPADLEPRERLERFVAARSAAVGQQVGILRLVPSEQFTLALPPGSASRLAGCAQKTAAFLRKCVRDGQASGVFRTDLDANALAVVVMGTTRMLALSSSGREGAGAGPGGAVAVDAQAVRQALLALLAPAVAKGQRASKQHQRRGKPS